MISILLPTHNGSRTIEAAVRSVFRQTYRDFELIVIDDGSTDDAAERALKSANGDARVRIIKNEINLGIQKTLNKGISIARGDLIARIDDDDEWIDVQKLAAQVSYFEANPKCVLVGTGTVVVNEKGKEVYRFMNPADDADIRVRILFRNCFTHSSVVFRKSVALAVGGYGEGEDARHVEDWDLWLRMGEKGSMANLQNYAVQFLVTANSISGKNKLDQMKKAVVLAKKFSRNYPNAWTSILKSTLRYWAFIVIAKTGLKLRSSNIIAAYKKL